MNTVYLTGEVLATFTRPITTRMYLTLAVETPAAGDAPRRVDTLAVTWPDYDPATAVRTGKRVAVLGSLREPSDEHGSMQVFADHVHVEAEL